MPLRPQAQVRYRPADSPQYRCGSCAHFIAPNACQIVEPPTDPNGVCDLYEPGGQGQAREPAAFGSLAPDMGYGE